MTPRILCDFDGTIVPEDVTDGLLERFALPEWRVLEEAWRAGRIGSQACMRGQVELLRVTQNDLNHYLDQVEIDPDFPAFVDHTRRLGWSLLVVSDGIDYAIRRILDRYGLGHLPVFANHLQWLTEESYRLTFPYAQSDCRSASGTCKCRVAHGTESSHSLNILIGDGASDFCVAEAVHMVWAKDRLLQRCREQGLPHLPFSRFRDCLEQVTSPVFLAQLLSSMIRTREVAPPVWSPLPSHHTIGPCCPTMSVDTPALMCAQFGVPWSE